MCELPDDVWPYANIVPLNPFKDDCTIGLTTTSNNSRVVVFSSNA